MQPKYVAHMERNPESLINLMCGAHSIQMYGRHFNFIIVQSAWVTELAVHERYDLKVPLTSIRFIPPTSPLLLSLTVPLHLSVIIVAHVPLRAL